MNRPRLRLVIPRPLSTPSGIDATADLVVAFPLATSVLQLRLSCRSTVAPSLARFTTLSVRQRAPATALVEGSDEVVDYLHILANSLRDRFRHRRTIADLHEATALHRRVIGLHQAGHPARASSVHDLARFRANFARADLEKAIELKQAAVELFNTWKAIMPHLGTVLRRTCKRGSSAQGYDHFRFFRR